MSPASRDRRSILQDFADHLPEAAAWLSNVVEGHVPAGVEVPRDVDPLDHLIALLREHGDREQALRLAAAAGELLVRWLSAHAEEPSPAPDALRRVSAILRVLEVVPAPPRVSARLFWLCQLRALAGMRYDGREIWHQALLALAISPPPQLDARRVEEFFVDQMSDPRSAVAAFTGMRRLSPARAVDHVPLLLRTLRAAKLPPHQPIWSLFRELEATPQLAGELALAIQQAPDVAAELERTLDDLRAAERFPAAWAAFKGRRDSGSRPDADVPGTFTPLTAFGADGTAAIAAARRKLAGSPAGLLVPVSAKAA